MKTTPQLTPQTMMIFIPNFKTRKVAMRQMIFSDDWVADCQKADEKYQLWYASMNEALRILGREPVKEI